MGTKEDRNAKVDQLASRLQAYVFEGRSAQFADALREIVVLLLEEADDQVAALGDKKPPVAFASNGLEDTTNKLNALIKRLKFHGIID